VFGQIGFGVVPSLDAFNEFLKEEDKVGFLRFQKKKANLSPLGFLHVFFNAMIFFC
jgi:hypothetical protein